MFTTPNLGLVAWNLTEDTFNTQQLAENFIKLDQHDHTPGKGTQIATNAIANGAVTAEKIHPDAVADFTVEDGSIVAAMLGSDSVTSAKIANDAVGATEIASGAVGSGELASGAVTRAKLATSSFQTQRVSFSNDQFKTITWSPAFATTNYTVVFGGQDARFGSAMIITKTTTDILVNLSAPATGTLHVLAIHD